MRISKIKVLGLKKEEGNIMYVLFFLNHRFKNTYSVNCYVLYQIAIIIRYDMYFTWVQVNYSLTFYNLSFEADKMERWFTKDCSGTKGYNLQRH